MDKKRLPFNQEEMIRCMEKDIQQQKEIIRTQNEMIQSLKKQVSIPEEQKQRLTEAGRKNENQF